jgi:RNase adaptor protein for sRNA GlmZ degradation
MIPNSCPLLWQRSLLQLNRYVCGLEQLITMLLYTKMSLPSEKNFNQVKTLFFAPLISYKAEQQLRESADLLKNKQAQLQHLEAETNLLISQYEDTLRQKNNLEKKVFDTNLKLNRSVAILQGLSEGKVRQNCIAKLQ